MIQSFKDKDTQAVFLGQSPKKYQAIQKQVERKLTMLDEAVSLDDLKVPPGNKLEFLQGDREGTCSIRVNQQFRICFKWTPKGPEDVEIVDYH